MKRLGSDRQGFGLILAVVVVLVIIIVLAALLIVPFRSIPVNESRQAALEQGIESLELNVNIDVGEVSVRFVEDEDVAVALEVSGHHRTGLLGSREPVNITWEERTEGDAIIVDADVVLGDSLIPFFSSDIDCTLLISSQLRTALSVSAGVGGLEVVTSDGVVLTSMDLSVSTGGVRATMVDNVTLEGPMSMRATTGGVDLSWTNVVARDNASMTLSTTTGGVRAKVEQTEGLGSNLTFTASANTGGIELEMNIAGDTSAHVTSTTTLGGVSVQERTGFNGTDTDLRSENYASESNFETSLNTGTGGVSLRLRYEA